MKTLITTGIILLCLTGCSNSKRIKNINEGKLEATKELMETGKKKFRLDTETKNKPLYLQLYKDKEGKEILTFLNARNNSICFYNYSDTTYLKQIAFQREGNNAVLSVSGYFIKSPDSIYLMNRPMIEIVLADSTAKVHNRIQLLDKTDKEWALTHPQYMLSGIVPMSIKENNLIIPGFAPFPKIMQKRDSFRFMTAINLSTNDVSYYHTYPEELFGDNANWGGDLMQMVYPTYSPDGKLIFSFPNSHNLYMADWNGNEMTAVYGGSNEAGAIASIDCSLDKEPDNEEIMSCYLEQDWYAGILHDPYRKVYYRYLQKAIPSATPKTSINDKTLAVIIMDEQFKYLGETEIGTMKQWNWTNSFVTEEGLNIEYNGTDISDDDYLTFGIFLPK